MGECGVLQKLFSFAPLQVLDLDLYRVALLSTLARRIFSTLRILYFHRVPGGAVVWTSYVENLYRRIGLAHHRLSDLVVRAVGLGVHHPLPTRLRTFVPRSVDFGEGEER